MTELVSNLGRSLAGLFWWEDQANKFDETKGRWEALSEKQIIEQIVKGLLAESCLVIRVNSGKLGNKVAFNRWRVSNMPWSPAGVCDLIAVYPDGITEAAKRAAGLNTEALRKAEDARAVDEATSPYMAELAKGQTVDIHQ